MDWVEERIRDLLEGDRHEREAAAVALRGRYFDVERLAPVLAHEHVSRQVKAIEVLRGHHSREAVALVVPFLASANPLLVKKAQSTLGRIGGAAADVIVAPLDAGAIGEHRLAVLDVLSRLGHPRGLEVLLVVADEWEPHRRRAALDCMRRYRDEPPHESIRNALFDRETRDVAIEVAGKIRHASFLDPLLDIWLGEEKPPRDAMYAIAKFGHDAVDALIARAASADRKRVFEALQWCMFTSEIALRIWELWKRREPAVRDACLAHFGTGYARSLASAPRRSALSEHHRDANVDRRHWCVGGWEQLAKVPGEDGDAAIQALRGMAEDDADAMIRLRAEAALRGLGRW
jgi:hypothetical protein